MRYYDQIERFGDAPAIITEEVAPLSYAALAAQADSTGSHCPARSLVFCLCENSLPSLTGYLGFLRARAVPLLLAVGIHDELLRSLLTTYKPCYMWLPAAALDPSWGDVVHADGHYVLVKTAHTEPPAMHPELAQLLTTSGSTGSPNLVRQTYRNIDNNAASISEYLGITAADRPITTLPMNYTYGLSILSSHLLQGAAIILTAKTLMDKAFWVLLKRHQASTFGGVPYIYEMLKRLRFGRMELPTIRYLTQAGGKLSVELTREFAALCADKGWRFIVMYGQVEATARMSWLPPDLALDKAGSIGKAIPGGAFWLEDEQGRRIDGPDAVGELVYSGPNVTLGYANCRADLANPGTNDGVLHTGDLAKRDADGMYYVVGRKKRVLKLFGNRINLEDVEQLVTQLGYSCACAGVDDNLRIYTTTLEHHAAIRAHVAERTGLHPSALKVIHIDAIPRNDAGKILYAALP
jgi:long-chain acyl-CoA synthetase